MTGEISDLSVDYKTNKTKVTLLIDAEPSQIEKFLNQKLNVEIEKYREKRRINANNYFWQLLQKICDEQCLNTITEYKRRVKELGIFRRFKIMVGQVKTFTKIWEDKGIAWFCEIADTEYIGDIEFKIINAYYGSSSYDKKQMSRLIDDLVQDCKAVGIETKTDAEIKSLLESWGK